MKKVGIITIHNSSNYGACLQSFALYKYIAQQDAYCEIIDVRRPIHKDYVYERNYTSYRNNPFTLRKRMKQALRKLVGRAHNVSQFASDVAEERFERFNAAINYSRCYNRLSDLANDPPVYDIYISGSDQLWNPAQPYCLDPYFLSFVPQGRTKISYATSIGITELTENEKRDFKKWLNTYDAISVREKQAKSLLDSFVGKKVETVADPTFLLDMEYWKKIAIPPIRDDKYIAVFLLSKNQELVDYAIRLSKESKLRLVILKASYWNSCNNYEVENDLGPCEFLGYLENASMVITDSFHCTVFSILMGADNFFTYISPTSQRGSRIIDLLETFGLDKHLLPCNFSLSYERLAMENINHEKVNEIVEKEKIRSRAFLDKWIK